MKVIINSKKSFIIRNNEYEKEIRYRNRNFIQILNFIKAYVESNDKEYYMFSCLNLSKWLKISHPAVLKSLWLASKLGLINIKGRQKDGTAEYIGYKNGHSRYCNTYNKIDINNITIIINTFKEIFPDYDILEDNTSTLKNFFNKLVINKKFSLNEVERDVSVKLSKELKEAYDIDFNYIEENKGRLINGLENTPGRNSENYQDRINKIVGLLHINPENITGKDINGSIYRLSYNMNHDKNFNFYSDIYTHLWYKLSGNFDFDREKFKHFIMKYYMRDNTGYQSFSFINYLKPKTYKTEEAEKLNNLFLTVFASKEFIDIDNYIGEEKKAILSAIEFKTLNYWMNKLGYKFDINDFENTLIEIKRFNQKIQSVLKNEFGIYLRRKNIFFNESNLHICMLLRFKELGVPVINIYDCFYGDKDILTNELFEQVYNESINRLKNEMDSASKKYIVRRYDRLKKKISTSSLMDEFGNQYVKYKNKIVTIFDDYNLLEYKTGEVISKEFFIYGGI